MAAMPEWLSDARSCASRSEAGEAVGVLRELGGEHLEGHVPPELRVGGAVDLAHAAGADRGRDPVVGERLADHEAGPAEPRAIACAARRWAEILASGSRRLLLAFTVGPGILQPPDDGVSRTFSSRSHRMRGVGRPVPPGPGGFPMSLSPEAPPARLTPTLVASTLVAALGGLLFGFDTAVISGTTEALRTTSTA